jgi:phosphomannomutase
VIVSAPDERKFQIIAALQQEFAAEHPVITLDGARVSFEHGWGLVRASNTQPAITMRFEARTKADLVAIMRDFDQRLARYPEVSREKLQEQIAAFSA